VTAVQIARVVGTVVTTMKDPGLDAKPLLLIQPVTPGGEATGRPLVASDSVGAGVGEHVFYVRGAEATFPFLPTLAPTDASIVGIIDHWTVE
jgi:microcompartment protein CcmK/EutM